MTAGSNGTEMTLKGEGIKTKIVGGNSGYAGGMNRTLVPQTNLSMSNDNGSSNANAAGGLGVQAQGLSGNNSSTKRPTAGGVSYTPSAASTSSASTTKRNAPIASMKKEDSSSVRRAAPLSSANESDSETGPGFSISSTKISPPKTINSESSGGSARKEETSGGFDDSDEENNTSSAKKALPNRGMSAKMLSFDDRVNSHEDLTVGPSHSGHNSARKDSMVKGITKPATKPVAGSGAPPGAQAIPVKVFSVDF